MSKGFLLSLFVLSCSVLFSQPKKEFTGKQGHWTATFFGSNVVKITFQPNGYSKNDNLSDAVIAKPVTTSPVKVSLDHDTLKINGNTIKLLPFVSTAANGFHIPLNEDEKFFGGGERALPLNRRGYRLNLYNNPWYGYGEGADNLNYSVPFITSSKGYGLFFDNPSKGYLDIGKTKAGVLELGATSGELTVYVILGDPPTVLHSYYKLTGTQPLPPRWALGNFMSRFGYTSETQVKDIYAKMKAEQIPVDAVIFDLFWFGDSIKGTLGNLDWVNRNKWPDPKEMIAGFKRDGVNTILVTEPFFLEGTKYYKASRPHLAVAKNGDPYTLTDFYFGRGGLIDIFRPDSKTWFWQLYKKQMQENGVEAWWGDLGEPEKHPDDLYHRITVDGTTKLFSADEVHNIYGHNWTKMLYENFAKDYPNKRLFSLNRSGFAGTQRYAIFPWTGDVSRSWSGYRAQLPVLLGMSMSGVPYVHSDAGGFGGGEGDEELYVRWLQFAAFTPIFRPHGTALYNIDPGAFSFPSEAALISEPYKRYAKDAINLRYSLLPYNYSLTYKQAKEGKPLMAPMYYYFATDTTAARLEDEYMWGESMLVAPILQKGETIRNIYLPKGRWFNLMRNQIIAGGRWISDTVSLATFPVFIKEGSFIPFTAIPSNAGSYDGSRLKLVYVPSSKASSYEIFNDDGVSKNSIATKQYELITLRSGGKMKNSLTLRMSSNGGRYAGKPSVRQIELVVPTEGRAVRRVRINNRIARKTEVEAVVRKQNEWTGTEKDLRILTQFTGKPVEIRITW